MTHEAVFPVISAATFSKTHSEDLGKRRRAKWMFGFCLSSSSGLLSMIFGLGLNGLAALGFVGGPIIRAAITVMLVIAFPLLFLAGHCLDKIQDIEKLMKIENLKAIRTCECGSETNK